VRGQVFYGRPGRYNAAAVRAPNTAHPDVNDEASYTCGACGEEIVVPIDWTQGRRQVYVEDCPVCCRANVIHVEMDRDGEATVWAELE